MKKHILFGVLFSIISVLAFGQVGSVGNPNYQQTVSYYCEDGSTTFYVVNIWKIGVTTPVVSDTFDINQIVYSPSGSYTVGMCPAEAAVCIEEFSLDGDVIKIDQENCPPVFLDLGDLLDSLLGVAQSMELDTFLVSGIADCSTPGSEKITFNYNADSGMSPFDVDMSCFAGSGTEQDTFVKDVRLECPKGGTPSLTFAYNSESGISDINVPLTCLGETDSVVVSGSVDCTTVGSETLYLNYNPESGLAPIPIDVSCLATGFEICNVSPNVGEFLAWDGTDWCPTQATGYKWIMQIDGNNYSILNNEVISVTGIGVVDVRYAGVTSGSPQTNFVEISIDPGTEGQVLTTIGGDVVWADPTGGTELDTFVVSGIVDCSTPGSEKITFNYNADSGMSPFDVDVSCLGSTGGDDWGNGDFIVSADSGSPHTVTDGSFLNFIGGNNVSTQMVGNSVVFNSPDNQCPTLSYNAANSQLTLTLDGCAVPAVETIPDTDDQCLNVSTATAGNGGTDVTLGIDDCASTVTFNIPPGSSGADDWGNGNFDVSGDTGITTIDESNTLQIVGGTGVTTTVSTADIVTINISGKTVSSLSCGAISGHIQLNYDDGSNDNVNLASCIQPCNVTPAGKLCYEECNGEKFVMIN